VSALILHPRHTLNLAARIYSRILVKDPIETASRECSPTLWLLHTWNKLHICLPQMHSIIGIPFPVYPRPPLSLPFPLPIHLLSSFNILYPELDLNLIWIHFAIMHSIQANIDRHGSSKHRHRHRHTNTHIHVRCPYQSRCFNVSSIVALIDCLALRTWKSITSRHGDDHQFALLTSLIIEANVFGISRAYHFVEVDGNSI
jgi:hypothetical protein